MFTFLLLKIVYLLSLLIQTDCWATKDSDVNRPIETIEHDWIERHGAHSKRSHHRLHAAKYSIDDGRLLSNHRQTILRCRA